MAQDVLTLESAQGQVGQPIEMDLSIQDVPGTILDTVLSIGEGFGDFSLKLIFDPNLVEDIEFVRAGVTNNVMLTIYASPVSLVDGIVGVISVAPNPMPLSLGAQAPGDLVSRLIVTPSAQAAGQTITFVVEEDDTFLAGPDNVTPVNTSNGTLIVNVGSVTVQGMGGGSPPLINGFNASPNAINSGGQSTLSWDVSNADTVVIDQGIGTVSSSGNVMVSPTVTTTYKLTATNGEGTSNQTVTVTVSAGTLPDVQAFSVNPGTILQGQQATLSWSVQNADTVQIDQGIGTVSSAGSQQVSPSTTTLYTLTAGNESGSVQAMVTLNVSLGTPPIIDSLTLSPLNIAPGGSSTLSWSVTNATLVQIDQGIGTVGLSGSRTINPANSTIYTLVATNGAGNAQRSVTLTVNALPVPRIKVFVVFPAQIIRGQPLTISWEVEDADIIDISGGIGRVQDAMGSLELFPDEDTDYLLVAENGSGSASANIEVKVFPETQIMSMVFDPAEIQLGQTSELSWESNGATNLILNPGNQSLPEVGSLTLSPSQTTTYKIMASGPLNQAVERDAQLVVSGDPALALSVEHLAFGSLADEVQVELSVNSTGPHNWFLESAPVWLEVAPTSGIVDQNSSITLTASVDRDLLFPGQNLLADLIFRGQGLLPVEIETSLVRPEKEAGASYLYYPLIEAGDEKESQITAINLSDVPVAVLLQVFNQDGSLAMTPVSETLQPLQSFLHVVSGLTSGQGWAVVTLFDEEQAGGNPTAAGSIQIRSTDGRQLYGLSAVTGQSAFLNVPHIARDTVNFFTKSTVVNLANEPRNLSLQANNGDQFQLGVLESGAATFFDYQEVMGPAIENAEWGSLDYRPATQSGAIGAEIFGFNTQPKTVGVGLNQQAANELYYVHIARDLVNFFTGIVVVNLGDRATDLRFQAYDGEGVLIDGGFVETFGAAGEQDPPSKKSYLVIDGRLDFGEGAAWVKISSDLPLIGYELFGNPPGHPGQQFAGFESIAELSNRLAISHTENAVVGGGWTGVAVINPNQTTADITIRLVSKEGVVKESENRVVESNRKLVELVSSLFDSEIALGDIVLLESSQKVAGFELFGSGTETMGALTAWSY